MRRALGTAGMVGVLVVARTWRELVVLGRVYGAVNVVVDEARVFVDKVRPGGGGRY